MLKVWHAHSLRFDTPAVFPADYAAVAEVESTFPHEAFELTNHIHYAWWENDRVRKLVDGAARSTSVGDIIEDLDGGALLLVKPFGFGRIDPADPLTFDSIWGS